MIRYSHILIIGFALALSACTSARWTVKDKHAVDKSEYEVLNRSRFLMKSGEISPDSPVLRLEIKSRTKYRFPQRVLAERTIQDYTLRPGFMAASLSGAALVFLGANSAIITKNRSKTHVWTLNAIGAMLAASGFFNMKAEGEPRPTGEQRYLRKSGSIVQVDTTSSSVSGQEQADITIQFGDITIFEDSSRTISDNQLEIHLAERLSELDLTGANPGNVRIQISFLDSLYSYQYPVSQVLQPYARITSRLTSLRNSPEISKENIVADLAKESQLPIKSVENGRWYRVMYGISEHFIPRDQAEIVWQTSDFIQKDEIQTVPRIPFGDIDVESNIPILRSNHPNSVALIVTNQEYSGTYSKRNYAHRDGRLIKTYLQNALGYPREQIFELQDISTSDTLEQKLAEIRSISNDSTELTVYLSGYGSMQREDNNELNLLGVSKGNNNEAISLRNIFEELSTITSGQIMVLNDIDFSHSISSGYSANQAQLIIEENVDNLTISNNRAAVLFSTHLNQPTSLYMESGGEDKKHHIFPYFFARALQQRKTDLAEIYQFLERNVSYTARKLHDHPQDPLLLGNSLLDLENE